MPQLDMDLVSLISASTQVGSLLDEILVTRQRDVEGRVLADLRQLHMCLNQLCLEYQTKLFNSMSGVMTRLQVVRVLLCMDRQEEDLGKSSTLLLYVTCCESRVASHIIIMTIVSGFVNG